MRIAIRAVLELVPEDETARHCKLVALIHLGKLEEAHELANGAKTRRTRESALLKKERAYCYYRNGDLGKALGMAEACEDTEGVMELKGQLLYRLGRREESKDVYERLLQSHKRGRVKADLLGNIIASYISAGSAGDVPSVLKQVGASKSSLEETPEIAYNNACVSLSLGKYAEAMDLLEVAERVGYESLFEDDLTEEETKEELAHVFAQKAFVLERLGRPKESQEQTAQVLKCVSQDDVTLAIATNNLAALRGSANVHDSLKRFDKLQALRAESEKSSGKVRRKNSLGDATGLVLSQDFAGLLQPEESSCVLSNYAACALLAGRPEAAERTAERALEACSGRPDAAATMALALARQGREDEALSSLDEFRERGGDPEAAAVAKCEIAVLCSKWKQAANALLSLPEDKRHQPAAIATALWLLERSGDKSRASSAVDACASWWDSQASSGALSEGGFASYARALKICGQFRFRSKDPDGAAALYQKVLDRTDDPQLRSEAMAGLVQVSLPLYPEACFCGRQFAVDTPPPLSLSVQLHGVSDASLADRYESEMPPVPGLEELDVELLEQATVRSARGSQPRTQGAMAAPSAAKDDPAKPSSAAQDEVYATKSKAQRRREFLRTLPEERQEYVAARQKEQRRKKAKRKAKQPADCAGEPDPERWIPKRDRSGYKKTRREKKLAKSVVKGSQGAGKVNEMLDKSQAPVDTTRGPNLPNLPRRRKR